MTMHQRLHTTLSSVKILYHIGAKEALLGWVRRVTLCTVCIVKDKVHHNVTSFPIRQLNLHISRNVHVHVYTFAAI